MSYSLVQGNLKPDMLIPLTAPGSQAELAAALAVNMRWTKPDGTTVVVPLVVVDLPTFKLKRVWDVGDSDIVGVHKGVVEITCSNGETTDDPIDGTAMLWWVYPTLGT